MGSDFDSIGRQSRALPGDGEPAAEQILPELDKQRLVSKREGAAGAWGHVPPGAREHS